MKPNRLDIAIIVFGPTLAYLAWHGKLHALIVTLTVLLVWVRVEAWRRQDAQLRKTWGRLALISIVCVLAIAIWQRHATGAMLGAGALVAYGVLSLWKWLTSLPWRGLTVEEREEHWRWSEHQRWLDEWPHRWNGASIGDSGDGREDELPILYDDSFDDQSATSLANRELEMALDIPPHSLS